MSREHRRKVLAHKQWMTAKITSGENLRRDYIYELWSQQAWRYLCELLPYLNQWTAQFYILFAVRNNDYRTDWMPSKLCKQDKMTLIVLWLDYVSFISASGNSIVTRSEGRSSSEFNQIALLWQKRMQRYRCIPYTASIHKHGDYKRYNRVTLTEPRNWLAIITETDFTSVCAFFMQNM